MERRILLADDDIDFGTTLKKYLELNKFEVVWAKDGAEALDVFKMHSFDIVIIDVMMPRLDGFKLSKKISKKNPETPFLFLTARKAKEDRIKGLSLGADDYISKPFEVEELILRINNIIKRTQQHQTISLDSDKEEGPISIGKYLFDVDNLSLTINGETSKITEKEAQLLLYLFQNKNKLISRDDILSNVWGHSNFFSGRSMDVFITRIRKRLNADDKISINSVRGVGLEFLIEEE
ncbi:response regulator transcription factor [Subsaxibacter sp. CAU 1640]|uniref:response regulator transcription factor n=1 Tax=Subsaxibacter sp. CAU 1640 TaxID=2933271 RepID=UPI002004E16A|nr:response regulator transcription factor [Subsaxibacter sp. CAU 1640]MCK7590372.1 response regulator transcription factor [Subsaxibacter sp. CAU 1640]